MLCCFLLGCQTASKEVRFKNPLFYEKMHYFKDENWWRFLTPSSMTEVYTTTRHFDCDLLENEETYIVLNCQSVIGNNLDAITLQKDTIHKFELSPKWDRENYKSIKHSYRLTDELPEFFSVDHYIIYTNDTK